jgi:hypothetical protein
MARWRGFSFRRITLDMLGTIIGAAVGATPGALLALGPFITISTEGGADVVTPLAVLAAGGVTGGLAAMAAVDRWLATLRPPWRAWAAALAGLALGVAACFAAILLGQQTAAESVVFLLMPPSTAAATVAAYTLADTSGRKG